MGASVWKRINVVGPRKVNELNAAGYGQSGPEKSWTMPSLRRLSALCYQYHGQGYRFGFFKARFWNSGFFGNKKKTDKIWLYLAFFTVEKAWLWKNIVWAAYIHCKSFLKESRYPVKGRDRQIAELGCWGLMMQPESLEPIFCVEQWELNSSKNKFIAKGDIILW